MLKKNITRAFAVGTLASSLLCASLAWAGPHGGPGPHGRPGPHGLRGPHHPAPVHQLHRGHHHSHHHRLDWLWAPVAAGAVVYGISQLAQHSSDPTPVPTPNRITQSSSAQHFVYWCELEQGYYPTVRSCPSGWKTMPAP